jgi:hypothetical protein
VAIFQKAGLRCVHRFLGETLTQPASRRWLDRLHRVVGSLGAGLLTRITDDAGVPKNPARPRYTSPRLAHKMVPVIRQEGSFEWL